MTKTLNHPPKAVEAVTEIAQREAVTQKWLSAMRDFAVKISGKACLTHDEVVAAYQWVMCYPYMWITWDRFGGMEENPYPSLLIHVRKALFDTFKKHKIDFTPFQDFVQLFTSYKICQEVRDDAGKKFALTCDPIHEQGSFAKKLTKIGYYTTFTTSNPAIAPHMVKDWFDRMDCTSRPRPYPYKPEDDVTDPHFIRLNKLYQLYLDSERLYEKLLVMIDHANAPKTQRISRPSKRPQIKTNPTLTPQWTLAGSNTATSTKVDPPKKHSGRPHLTKHIQELYYAIIDDQKKSGLTKSAFLARIPEVTQQRLTPAIMHECDCHIDRNIIRRAYEWSKKHKKP